jgi:predicted SAM-dependent methyltransferase
VKLHLGGTQPKDGWTILDIESRPEVDIVAPADAIPLPDRSCTAIYASHILEHFPLAKAAPVLHEWRRVLADDGVLMVSVPDLRALAGMYLVETDPRAMVWLMRVMFGGQVNQHDFHHVGWDFSLLCSFLMDAGFDGIERVAGFGLFDDSSNIQHRGQLISLNLMATPALPDLPG